MGKREFINSLREHLEGEVPAPIIEKNIRYYDSYISEHGESCIKEIGEPRWIATTIITSYKMSGQDDYKREEYFEEERRSGDADNPKKEKKASIKRKIMEIASIALGVVVLIVIFKMFLFLALRVILPVAAIAYVIYLIKKLLNG